MDILVTGAGPAGTSVAIALRRAGLDVELRSGRTRRPWLEGLSERTVEALAGAGCEEAAHLAARPGTWVERSVRWGARSGPTNREALVDRQIFDTALLRDAQRAGIRVVANEVRGSDGPRDEPSAPGGARVEIDARGRVGPRGADASHHATGPHTIALAVPCRAASPVPTASALVATEAGFWWIVTRSERRGGGVWALRFCDPPSRAEDAAGLRARCREELASIQRGEDGDGGGLDWLRHLRALSDPIVAGRDATPYLARNPFDESASARVRVGDAAFAGDPLSGQGVYRALATAAAAAAAVRTRLGRPASAAIATRFYRERVASIAQRETREARLFYREENSWPESQFWQRRQRGGSREPRDTGSLNGGERSAPFLETRPMVREGWVEEASVLVCAGYPQGIWSYDGIPVAALLAKQRLPVETLARHFGVAPERVRSALGWLAKLGALEAAASGTEPRLQKELDPGRRGIDDAAPHPAE